MFDAAILQQLEAPMPPQPPPFAEERILTSKAAAVARKLGERFTAAFDVAANGWMEELDGICSAVAKMGPLGSASQEDLVQLDGLIEDAEMHADMRAKHAARLAKRIRRDVKAHFAADPSIGAQTRWAGDRIIATDKRIVEALLDYALFLRALRAEGDPASRGGPSFDDPVALQRYLDSLAA